MRFQKQTGARPRAATVAILATSLVAFGWGAAAQDADAPNADAPVKAKKRHVVRKTLQKSAESTGAPAPAKAAAPSVAAAAQDKGATQSTVAAAPATVAPAEPLPQKTGPAPIDFTAQLDKAGASACSGQVNALATSTMGSVVKYNTVSNWSEVAGDKRAVSLAIGQKYADGSAVPFSLSQVIASPNRAGSCDGFTVQVFPSPLPCDKLRETIASRGRQIGDLAGIPLMQDATARTMLIPTVGNACVLVATRTVYAK